MTTALGFPTSAAMCTYILRYDPDSDWPFLIAGNRDELRSRPWQAPARHWDDREDIIAGQDRLAGGTWLGLSDTGVVAAILNKKKALGPAPNKRSRGEIVLDALDHPDAVDAAKALSAVNGDAYRPFNLIIADNRDAYWIAHEGEEKVGVTAIEPGVHIISHNDLDTGIRAETHIARAKSGIPTGNLSDPESWKTWVALLSERAEPDAEYWEAALNVDVPEWGFGTVSSALVALPNMQNEDAEPVFLFADGPADRESYRPVDLT